MRSGGVSRAAATPIAGMAIGWYAASGAVNQPRRCHALSRQMTAARRTFVDTNVLLYAHDASETERQPIARALLENTSGKVYAQPPGDERRLDCPLRLGHELIQQIALQHGQAYIDALDLRGLMSQFDVAGLKGRAEESLLAIETFVDKLGGFDFHVQGFSDQVAEFVVENGQVKAFKQRDPSGEYTSLRK